MGVVFFMMFLAVLFCIALFFIVLSIVFIIVWNVKKSRGKTPKKRWLVIPSVFLVINLIVAFIPIGYIGFLRYANSMNTNEIVYAESGETLFWPMGEIEPTHTWFEMDGIKYVEFREGFSEDPFFLDVGDEKLGEPVANIKNDPSTRNAFNEFMWLLLAGDTTDKLNVSTVYPVTNDNGFAFYKIKGSSGNGTYCPEDKMDSIKAYYADLANYDTQNLIYKYAIYTEMDESGKEILSSYTHVKKAVVLTPGAFEELRQLLDSRQGIQRVETPPKYKDTDEEASPSVPIPGYEERELYAYSNDKMAYHSDREVDLVLFEGQVYAVETSGSDYIVGCPLSGEMNQYIIDSVFVD